MPPHGMFALAAFALGLAHYAAGGAVEFTANPLPTPFMEGDSQAGLPACGERPFYVMQRVAPDPAQAADVPFPLETSPFVAYDPCGIAFLYVLPNDVDVWGDFRLAFQFACDTPITLLTGGTRTSQGGWFGTVGTHAEFAMDGTPTNPFGRATFALFPGDEATCMPDAPVDVNVTITPDLQPAMRGAQLSLIIRAWAAGDPYAAGLRVRVLDRAAPALLEGDAFPPVPVVTWRDEPGAVLHAAGDAKATSYEVQHVNWTATAPIRVEAAAALDLGSLDLRIADAAGKEVFAWNATAGMPQAVTRLVGASGPFHLTATALDYTGTWSVHVDPLPAANVTAATRPAPSDPAATVGGAPPNEAAQPGVDANDAPPAAARPADHATPAMPLGFVGAAVLAAVARRRPSARFGKTFNNPSPPLSWDGARRGRQGGCEAPAPGPARHHGHDGGVRGVHRPAAPGCAGQAHPKDEGPEGRGVPIP
ncbi:MAG: hypothetical protein LC620_01630, partial [Halobacteriales archaeon]|nr:hypothetical protein [Halobacteriales archaeon]